MARTPGRSAGALIELPAGGARAIAIPIRMMSACRERRARRSDAAVGNQSERRVTWYLVAMSCRKRRNRRWTTALELLLGGPTWPQSSRRSAAIRKPERLAGDAATGSKNGRFSTCSRYRRSAKRIAGPAPPGPHRNSPASEGCDTSINASGTSAVTARWYVSEKCTDRDSHRQRTARRLPSRVGHRTLRQRRPPAEEQWRKQQRLTYQCSIATPGSSARQKNTSMAVSGAPGQTHRKRTPAWSRSTGINRSACARSRPFRQRLEPRQPRWPARQQCSRLPAGRRSDGRRATGQPGIPAIRRAAGGGIEHLAVDSVVSLSGIKPFCGAPGAFSKHGWIHPGTTAGSRCGWRGSDSESAPGRFALGQGGAPICCPFPVVRKPRVDDDGDADQRDDDQHPAQVSR